MSDNKLNERIKILRKSLNLTQKDLGDKLGLKPNTISDLENGKTTATEQNIKLICRELNVNYMWLVTGEGDMFLNISNAILDQLIDAYNLTEDDKEIIESYINLSEQSRKVFVNYLKNIFMK